MRLSLRGYSPLTLCDHNTISLMQYVDGMSENSRSIIKIIDKFRTITIPKCVKKLKKCQVGIGKFPGDLIRLGSQLGEIRENLAAILRCPNPAAVNDSDSCTRLTVETYLLGVVSCLSNHSDLLMLLLNGQAVSGAANLRDIERKQIEIMIIRAELQALMVRGENSALQFNWRFVCCKTDAENFWKSTFGNELIVTWDSMQSRLLTLWYSSSEITVRHFLSLMNFYQCADFVTKFVFNLFTTLFAPWNNVLQVFQALSSHPGFIGMASFDTAKKILSKFSDSPGCYLFRFSCSSLGSWSIASVTANKGISQTIVRHKSIAETLMINAKHKINLYPMGKKVNPDLTILVEPVKFVDLDPIYGVSSAGSDLTAGDLGHHSDDLEDAAWQNRHLCKICFENPKNIQLEPCQHLLCKTCHNDILQKSSLSRCPFCRSDIRSTVTVNILGLQDMLGDGTTSIKTSSSQAGFSSPPLPIKCEERKLPPIPSE